MSLPSHTTAHVRADEPAAQDPPVGVEDHNQFPIAGEVESPGLSHSMEQLVHVLATFCTPPYHNCLIPCKPSSLAKDIR